MLKGIRSRSVPSLSESQAMRSAKRSCRHRLNIDDLPDPVLVDILSRLPCKAAVQCKCVSKRWFGLISEPFFLDRFLRLQILKQKPIIRTLIFSDTEHNRKFFHMSSASSEPRSDNWSDFSFVPCFQPPINQKNGPVVLGAYNDLVLCCATTYFQRVYYICNPCTKKWVCLPPVPGSKFFKVRVGFICEPFYKQVIGETEEEESKIQLDFEYSYKVVRITHVFPEDPTPHQFYLEVFSSETRRWENSIVVSPQSFNFDTLPLDLGTVYKGMLYWWSVDGFMIGLDLDDLDLYSNKFQYRFHCHFIDKPQDDWNIERGFNFLGVCRGRMRLCQFFTLVDQYGVRERFLSIWEFRKDHVDENDRWCLIDTLSMDQMISENPLISDWEFKEDRVEENHLMAVLAFDPNNEDILFLEVAQHIVMCNIRTKTLTETNTTPYTTPYKSVNWFQRSVFPLVLPWWPTPVPRLPVRASYNCN